MKIQISSAQQGGVLVTVLVVTMLLTLAVASMLEIVSQEYALSKRTLSWNQAIYTAESGIEVGWNEVNKTTGINSTNGTPFLSSNGWADGGGSTNFTYYLTVTNSTFGGADAVSYVGVNVFTNSPAGGSCTILANATNYSALIATPAVRNLKAILTPVKPFTFGILTKGLLNFNGNSATLDSWNSGTTGNYNVANRRAHGNIGTDGLVLDSGGLSLYGSPSTGPGGVWTGAAPIQPVAPDTGVNAFQADTQVSIPDAALPSNFSSTPTVISTTGSSIGPITAAGDYSLTTMTKNTTFGSTNVLASAVTIRVHITNATSINIGGSDNVQIKQPASGPRYTVQLYVDGSINFSGTQDTNVLSGARPADLQVYGLPTCTSLVISGNSKTQAVFYCPNAAVSMNGGGHEAFYGSIVGNTFTANGGIDFHYDETLTGTGVVTGYNLTQWIEY